MKMLLAPLAALLSSCTLSQPFRTVAPIENSGSRVVVAITHARVKKEPGAREVFARHTDRVVDSLRLQPGLVGYSLRRSLMGDRVWTMTVWRDEASRAAFVSSTTHQAAMAEALPKLALVRFARREVPAAEAPPKWDQALAWLETEGRGYPLAPVADRR